MNEELIFINPTKEYEKELKDYIKELYEYNSEFHGVNDLQNYVDNFDEWLEMLEKDKTVENTEQRVQADTFILVRKIDSKVLGIINLRYYLNDFLYKYGGNIGYNVRPTERKKGYNLYQLKKVLEICKEKGLEKVLITCDKDNIGSSASIIKCGGILENEILDNDGTVIGKGKVLHRYWINLK